MRTYLDCIPCFIRQGLEAARLATEDEKVHEMVVRKLAVFVNELKMSQSPPFTGQKIHRLIRELVGVEDPYRKAKTRFNEIALRLYPEMREIIINSDDPIETAIRLAIAGNVIDLGVNGTLQETDLEEAIHQCLASQINGIRLEPFRNALNDAEDILYIADNAGEIVFDRLLIEQLPTEKIAVAVKGLPIINDATMEDACLAGLPRIVEVIDNGSDAPGTILESCSESFRFRFEKSDLIIAKGQGNYETLSDIDRNIFFVLKVKCPVIASHIGCEVGQMIFQNTKTAEGERANAGL